MTAVRGFLAEVVPRALVLLGLIAVLGPPITDNVRFLTLVAAGFLALTLPLRHAPWRIAGATVVVVVAALAPSLLPRAAIEEGHNVFLYPGAGAPTVLERELPTPVFDVLRDQFVQQYPNRECDRTRRENKGGAKCWRDQKMPDRWFAFSAESLWRPAKYSRVVDRIGFDGLADLRTGFVADAGYDWNPGTGAVVRDTMPYFVAYDLPAAVVGGRLCWRGHVMWEGPNGTFAHLSHDAFDCRVIERDDTGRRVFGLSVLAGAPLAMDLELPGRYRIAGLAALAVRLVGVVGLLLLCFSPPAGAGFRRQAILLGCALAGMGLYSLTRNFDFIFGGNPPIMAGWDGLDYVGFARSIVIGLANGDLIEALRGGQDVFLKMPGLPYIRALERVVFGDTNYLYVAALIWLPFAVWALAATVVSRRWAWWFAVLFIPLPIFGNIGLWYYNYLHRGMDFGASEPLAMTLFFAALALTLHNLPRRYLRPGLAANMMFALAVLCRPNFGAGAVVIIAVASWYLWRRGRLGEAVIAAAGFLPVLFMVWHNYYFGDVFVLATTIVATADTMPTPPAVYAAALGDLFSLDFGGGAWRKIARQWQSWLHGWWLLPVLLWLLYSLARGRLSAEARMIAYAALAQHGVLLFWNPGSRFTDLAWALTVFALLPDLARATDMVARRWWSWRGRLGRPRNP